MFKKYMVYLDCGTDCIKTAVPATSKANARKYVDGNGDIVDVREFDCPISVEKVGKALKNAGFGWDEIDLITRTLIQTRIAD